MRWLWKAVAFATLLAWPGYAFAPIYQSVLLALTSALTGRQLMTPADGAVDLSASNVLTIYVALCLASDFAGWGRRVRALGLGVPLLVLMECATGILGISLAQSAGSDSLATRRLVQVAGTLLELSRWIGVPMIWGLLMGRQWLSAASARTQGAPFTKRDGILPR